MTIVTSEVVNQRKEKIKIVGIQEIEKKPSRNGGEYTLITFIADDGREIVAAGKWTESWKEGDEVEGILQEKVVVRVTDGVGKEIITTLFLANPEWLQ